MKIMTTNVNLATSSPSTVANQKGLHFLSLLLTFILTTVQGIPVHQLDSSCSSFCGDHYHSLAEWTSCARGCRFFSLIQIHVKPQPFEVIEKSCINTCNKAYNETQLRKACSRGCRKSIEMINSVHTGNINTDHQLINPTEQWIHHLGMSPFDESMEEAQHRDVVWPFNFIHDIFKQLTDQLTTSTNWIKTRASYTLLFGDNGSSGRQIFLVRARPHLTLTNGPSSLLPNHPSLTLNPIHEQSTFHVIAFPSSSGSSFTSSLTPSLPSSSSSSHSSPSKQIKLSSSSVIIPLTHNVNYQADRSQTFTRWASDTVSTAFKDLRLLMALLLAIVILSIVTFSEALCWTADGRNKRTTITDSSTDGLVEGQEKMETDERTSSFFVLDSSMKTAKEAEANGKGVDDVGNREAIIQEESERPPTYDETVKTSTINFESMTSSRESKA